MDELVEKETERDPKIESKMRKIARRIIKEQKLQINATAAINFIVEDIKCDEKNKKCAEVDKNWMLMGISDQMVTSMIDDDILLLFVVEQGEY